VKSSKVELSCENDFKNLEAKNGGNNN